VHNWFRGGPLQTYDDSARTALAGLEGRLDLGPAAEMWAASLAAPWDGTDQWFHGDLAPGNLVMREGRLAAVIDFGTCGVGDPACDLAAAWTLLTSEARRVFRDALAVDDAEWERGRGWALWKALVTCHAAAGEDGGDNPELTEARRVLDEILDEAG
jgi:aminoglycoside phosphotransferase (APT) family kinase protein